MGLIQGLTEYLPVSSSGHLAIAGNLFGLGGEENLTFTIAVHVATVLSTIVILWKEIWWLLKGLVDTNAPLLSDERKYCLAILVSMIPVGIVGVFFKDTVEEIFGSGLVIVGFCLIITAALLTMGYYFARAVNRETGVPIGIVDNSWGGCSIDQFLPGAGQDLGMVSPLSRMRFAGVLWFQGEANWGAVRYREKLSALVGHWLGMWGRDLPFYIAQLSSWRDPNWTRASTALDAPKQGFETMRNVQLEMHRLIPRSGLVVTFDIGNENDIHFRNKLDVGERFARWALRDVYGRKDIAAFPIFRS